MSPDQVPIAHSEYNNHQQKKLLDIQAQQVRINDSMANWDKKVYTFIRHPF